MYLAAVDRVADDRVAHGHSVSSDNNGLYD
jgi:hypothetical protein